MNNYRASMQELEMFAAIAQHLSFRKAAEEKCHALEPEPRHAQL